MMPTPTHLQNCVSRPDVDVDTEPLNARVVCHCGCDELALLHPGQMRELNGVKFPVEAEIDGNYFLVLKARCSRCRTEHLLLDSHYHGWNGYICREAQQIALPRPPLECWQCVACHATVHRMVVQILSEGFEEFEGEWDFDLDPNTWPDAFAWFSLDTTCTSCGLTTERLIDFETM